MSVLLATVGVTKSVPTLWAATSVPVATDGCWPQTNMPVMVSSSNTTTPLNLVESHSGRALPTRDLVQCASFMLFTICTHDSLLQYILLLLFFVVEIFSDSTHYPKICYSNIIPFQSIFSIEILWFSRWLIVVPSIDHNNSVPDTCVGGFFRASQSSPTAAAYLSLYT